MVTKGTSFVQGHTAQSIWSSGVLRRTTPVMVGLCRKQYILVVLTASTICDLSCTFFSLHHPRVLSICIMSDLCVYSFSMACFWMYGCLRRHTWIPVISIGHAHRVYPRTCFCHIPPPPSALAVPPCFGYYPPAMVIFLYFYAAFVSVMNSKCQHVFQGAPHVALPFMDMWLRHINYPHNQDIEDNLDMQTAIRLVWKYIEKKNTWQTQTFLAIFVFHRSWTRVVKIIKYINITKWLYY